MIEPAETSSPSPRFTPRRWPTLSRPFLELEPAFLWAIAGYSSFLVRVVFLGAGAALAAGFVAAAFLGSAFPAGLGAAAVFVVLVAAFLGSAVALVDVFGSALALVFGDS